MNEGVQARMLVHAMPAGFLRGVLGSEQEAGILAFCLAAHSTRKSGCCRAVGERDLRYSLHHCSH